MYYIVIGTIDMNCEQYNKIPLQTVLKSMTYAALFKHWGGELG